MSANFIPKLKKAYDIEQVIMPGGNPQKGETGFRQLKVLVDREPIPIATIDVKSIGNIGIGLLLPKKDGDIIASLYTEEGMPFIATISRKGLNGMRITINEINPKP